MEVKPMKFLRKNQTREERDVERIVEKIYEAAYLGTAALRSERIA